MAGTHIRIDTGRVEEIAGNMETLNTKLEETLEETRATVNELASSWQGEAADTTINAFNTFANNYFQSYKDVISQYVSFLRAQVAQGWEQMEVQNVSLGDSFK